MKTRSKRKKNPEQENFVKVILSNSSDYEFLGEGAFGETWYFITDKNIKIDNTIIPVGEYVIKVFFVELEEQEFKYLKILSKAKLIPNHYIITPYYVIMDFVDGRSLRYWKKQLNFENKKRLFNNIKDEILKWHKKGFSHGDLFPDHDNILIDKNLNVKFIDPDLSMEKPNFDIDFFELEEIQNFLKI